MKQSNKRTIIFIICSLLLLAGGLTLAIRLGSVHITFSDIWDSIFNYSETLELMLVRDVRIPRALAVLFTGGVLGVTAVSYTHLKLLTTKALSVSALIFFILFSSQSNTITSLPASINVLAKENPNLPIPIIPNSTTDL